MLCQQIAFTRQKDFCKEAQELKWAYAQRTLHGLHPPETKMFTDRGRISELNQMAEEAKRRAEIGRYSMLVLTFVIINGLGRYHLHHLVLFIYVKQLNQLLSIFC